MNNTSNRITYNDNGFQILPEDFKRFRLNIDFNDLYTMQILQIFHHSATIGFDYGLEIKSPEGVASDVHWIFNEEPYIAQAFSFDEDLRIPLVINLDSQQSIRFRILDIQNFNLDQTIYLHDMESVTYFVLTKQEYEVNLEVGEYANRFEITFVNQVLESPESESNQLVVFQNNSTSQLTISNPNNLEMNEVKAKLKNDKCIRSIKVRLSFTELQKDIIKNWMTISAIVYNKCVDEYNLFKDKTKNGEKSEFEMDYMKLKLDIFKKCVTLLIGPAKHFDASSVPQKGLKSNPFLQLAERAGRAVKNPKSAPD